MTNNPESQNEAAAKLNPKQQFEKYKEDEIHKLDKELKQFKIPIVLLERLKKEFDDSHYLSNEIGKPITKESQSGKFF